MLLVVMTAERCKQPTNISSFIDTKRVTELSLVLYQHLQFIPTVFSIHFLLSVCPSAYFMLSIEVKGQKLDVTLCSKAGLFCCYYYVFIYLFIFVNQQPVAASSLCLQRLVLGPRHWRCWKCKAKYHFTPMTSR